MIYYLYPLLLCTIPVHAVFVQNLGEVETKHYLESLLIISAIVIMGCCGLNVFIKNILLSEFIFCVLFFLLLYANNIYFRCMSNFLWEKKKTYIPFLIFYFLSNIFIMLCLYYLFNNVNLLLLSKIVFYVSIFIIVSMLCNYFNGQTKGPKIHINNATVINKEKLPDIYHIVLDAHIGYEKEEYRDNYFFNELEKRGFFVVKNFKSNYNITHLSMPSIFNMDYLHNILHKKDEDYYASSETYTYYGNNRLWKLLENLDYSINITVNPMFNKIVENSKIRICKDLINGINANLRSLCFTSIFAFLLLPLKRSFEIFNLQLEKYTNFCKIKTNKNTYNFMHILAPHGPLLYDANGKPLSRDESNDFSNYFSYLKYVDKRILEIVDIIQGNMNKNAIIIIHGDHGISLENDVEFNTLCCIYFPDQNYDNIPKNLTAVNLFPVVLNQFFGTKIEYKKNAFFKKSAFDDYVFNMDNIKNISKNKIIAVNNYELKDFEKRLRQFSQQYRNKKVVLYGAGKYFKYIKQNLDLSVLNIEAVSDKKFEGIENPIFDREIGYNIIAPQKIYTLSPDIVIIAVQEIVEIKKYFHDELFKTTQKCFKYTSFEEPGKTYKKLQKLEWAKVLFP